MKFKEILIYRPPLRRQDLNVILGTGGLSFFSTKITLRSRFLVLKNLADIFVILILDITKMLQIILIIKSNKRKNFDYCLDASFFNISLICQGRIMPFVVITTVCILKCYQLNGL